jgi:hypothetical protein
MLETARRRDHKSEAIALTLSPALYPFPGQLADVAMLKGKSGWLQAAKVSVTRSGVPTEQILVSCLTDSGELIEPATADRMLLVPAVGQAVVQLPQDRSRLGIVEEEHLEEFKRQINEENARWLDEEEARLDNYAKDVEVELDAQIAALEDEIKELQRQRRSPELGMEDKLRLGRDIKRREGAMDDLKLSKFEKRKAIRKQVGEMMDEIADSLQSRPVTEHLFTMRWSVV